MIAIYVAASSGEIERAKYWMQRLKDAGFTVVSNWPEVIAAAGNVANPRDAADTRGARQPFRVQVLREDGRWGDVAGRNTLSEACAYVWAQLRTTPNGLRVSYRVREGRRTVATMAWTATTRAIG